jgi:hypothetical protein
MIECCWKLRNYILVHMCVVHVPGYCTNKYKLYRVPVHTHTTYYIRGCIFTPPELVGLWLGSVHSRNTASYLPYSAYEFVTCYDRCMSCTGTCIN